MDAFEAFSAFLVAVVVAAVVFIVWDINHVNQINNNFRTHCTVLHGTTVIADKDLCLDPSGRVILHEK